MSGHAAAAPDHDVLIIGAGFSGIAMLHKAREQGMSARVFEMAAGVGGTWWWNTYPGARTDSESWYYCFSFSKPLLEKWRWTERYPGQPEMQAYFNFALDELGLRPHIQCGTRMESARWVEAARCWSVASVQGDGRRATTTARYLVSAMGILSEPIYPKVPGLDRFEGICHHTGRWPQEGVDLTGKRVGILGAGASAVQFLPHAAEQADHVTLFQRTPNFIFPARNRPLTEDENDAVRADYDAIWRRARTSPFAMPFEHCPTNRMATQTPAAERERIYAELWKIGGFRFFFESFDDLIADETANQTAAEFMRQQIRATVKDPDTAESLCPQYPLFAKRPPSEQGYFEAFNRPNVRLVDVRKNAVTSVEPRGVRTQDGEEHPLDVLVLATGFQAFIGGFEKAPVHGRGGVSLMEHWKRHGIRTFLGSAVHGFPNFFMLGGPTIPIGNAPTIIEHAVDMVLACIVRARQGGRDCVAEVSSAAENEWTSHVAEVMNTTLVRHADDVGSWFSGANVEGQARTPLVYMGGATAYFERMRSAAETGFRDFAFG